MASLQEKKIIVLADHIISHGINLSDLPIIIEAKDEADRYSVLDGNRRLTALRGLETPNLVKGAISNRNFKKLKDLSKKYLKEPIETIWTVQADTREEADPWIKLRHRGESGGAGLVEWDGEAGARYDKRRGEATPHLDLLNFVLDKGNLRDNIKSSIKSSFPITTLERLVRDPDIRTFTGIDVRKGIVYTRLPDDEVLKPWEKIITELAKGTTTVSDVKVKEDRLKYIGDFDKGQLPDQSKSGSTRKLGQDPGEGEEETNDKKKKKNKKKTKPSLSRDSLIPKETSLHISEKKNQ
ncbi:MAG: hypothetical protein CL670_00690 [Balneola sp.]|jgi:hypothetical protein|nr:hypothetical protein [Balneola sp.]MBE77650.1 hypothetical protein [Balneola sp.]